MCAPMPTAALQWLSVNRCEKILGVLAGYSRIAYGTVICMCLDIGKVRYQRSNVPFNVRESVAVETFSCASVAMDFF